MASSALINALSGFWHQFFRDLPDIDVMYQGTEHLAGQFYRDLLNSVLCKSVRYTPLLRADDCVLLDVGTSEFLRDPNNPATGRLLPNKLSAQHIGFLQDALIHPSTILDQTADYSVTREKVVLKNDPRETFVRSARRASPVGVSAVLQSSSAKEVVAGDVITIGGKAYTVAYANSHDIGLSPGYVFSVPDQTVTWSVEGSTPAYTGRLVAPASKIGYEDRYAIWAVAVGTDDYTLFNNFGYLLRDTAFAPETPTPSTEQYRNFLVGVYRLLYGGPTEGKLEAAINAIAGLPLVSSPDEKVLQITAGQVLTDRRVYALPTDAPLHPDVQVGATLKAFRPLTKIVTFFDNTNHPYWWYKKTVPQQFLPQMSEDARYVTAEMRPNYVGERGSGQWPVVNVIGNVDLKVGVSHVEKASYFAMGTILKHHLFGVKLHPYVGSVDGAEGRIRNLLLDVRPSHKYPYIWVE